MRRRDIKTAEKFRILEQCKAFERDLLQIKDIVPCKSGRLLGSSTDPEGKRDCPSKDV